MKLISGVVVLTVLVLGVALYLRGVGFVLQYTAGKSVQIENASEGNDTGE